jgi:hypothetical protein
MMSVFDVILGVKNRFRVVSPVEKAVLTAIASDVANPYVLMGQDLLRIPGSLSSGVLQTFIVNNIANSFYIRLAYMNAFRSAYPGKTRECALAHFEENVVFFALGDDNTFSISSEALKFFNFKIAQTFFAKVGIKYTLADKTDDAYGSVPVSQASIGKRMFVPDDNDFVCAPIEKPTIGKIVTMALEGGPLSLVDKQKECLVAAALELSQHGRKTFDDSVEKLRKIGADLNCNVVYPTYDELKQKQIEGKTVPVASVIDTCYEDSFAPN